MCRWTKQSGLGMPVHPDPLGLSKDRGLLVSPATAPTPNDHKHNDPQRYGQSGYPEHILNSHLNLHQAAAQRANKHSKDQNSVTEPN